jgi:pimeloyl-ACP methyl ester carboxylesterase
MKRAEADGRWLEYEEAGSGEPVLLIHGTLIGDALKPLLNEDALAGSYRLIRYRRRGFYDNQIPPGAGWLDISDHAADAAMLLDFLGIDQVHVVGYDLGGVIALQLALDLPQTVHSLALLEPVLMGVPDWESTLGEVAPAIDLFLAGDRPGAVEAFLAIASGPEAADTLERQMPGALAQAVHDAPGFFEGEMFAIGEWQLAEDVGFDISQPVLSVLSEHPIGFFAEGRTLLRQHLPQTEDLDVFNATHLLPVENPEMLASGLAWFLGRHPMRRPPAG